MSHQKGVLQAKGPGLGIVTAFGILDIEKAVPTDLAEDLGPNILLSPKDCSQLPHFWSV